jgi:cytochrome c oxidase cbb3-type subunit 2
MIQRTQHSAVALFAGVLLFFLVGGLLTTVVPAVAEASWRTPVSGAREPSAAESRGRAIYQREGCWYCHTQQIRTLEADTKRYGWRGVDAPISEPGEFARDRPHFFGTRRVGPDLARVGGKYDRSWHRTHFKNPRHLVPGSVMPPFPWLFDNGEREFEDLVAYIQSLGRNKSWRPSDDYEQ